MWSSKENERKVKTILRGLRYRKKGRTKRGHVQKSNGVVLREEGNGSGLAAATL